MLQRETGEKVQYFSRVNYYITYWMLIFYNSMYTLEVLKHFIVQQWMQSSSVLTYILKTALEPHFSDITQQKGKESIGTELLIDIYSVFNLLSH